MEINKVTMYIIENIEEKKIFNISNFFNITAILLVGDFKQTVELIKITAYTKQSTK